MNNFWKQSLSFQGRLSRGRFLRLYLRLAYLSGAILVAGLFAIIAEIRGAGYVTVVSIMLLWFFQIPALVRRFHGREMSGWFAAVSFACFLLSYPGQQFPLIFLLIVPVQLWLLVESFFRKGTAGPNRYGDDPLRDPLLGRK